MNEINDRELETPRTILPKYSYPIFMKLFLLSLPLLFVGTVPTFIWYDLPRHKTIHARIAQARDAFVNGDYYEAAILYEKLLQIYPNFKEGRIELIKSCFALSYQEDDARFYQTGLSYLGGESYERWEIYALQEYAPQRYKNDFEQRFTL